MVEMESVIVQKVDNIIQLQQYNMNTFVVVKELENGYIIMAPDGETGYITEDIYQKLKSQGKIF
jgi:hypothetical protein